MGVSLTLSGPLMVVLNSHGTKESILKNANKLQKEIQTNLYTVRPDKEAENRIKGVEE